MIGLRFILCTSCCVLVWAILTYAGSEEVFFYKERAESETVDTFKTGLTSQSLYQMSVKLRHGLEWIFSENIPCNVLAGHWCFAEVRYVSEIVRSSSLPFRISKLQCGHMETQKLNLAVNVCVVIWSITRSSPTERILRLTPWGFLFVCLFSLISNKKTIFF